MFSQGHRRGLHACICLWTPTSSILSIPAQPLSASGHAGWEGRMFLTIGGQGPQRELWQRFPRGMPGSLSQEHTQVLPLMSLKQWVSVLQLQLCLSRAAKPSAEPSLDAAAVSLEKPQGRTILKGRSKICPWVPPHLHCFLGVYCSPWKWVTKYKTFRGNEIKTPLNFCLVPGYMWVLQEQVLQCLPAVMGTCVTMWGHCGVTNCGLCPTHTNRDVQHWGSFLTKLGQVDSPPGTFFMECKIRSRLFAFAFFEKDSEFISWTELCKGTIFTFQICSSELLI